MTGGTEEKSENFPEEYPVSHRNTNLGEEEV
jgi:hypothetical protein